MGVTPSSTLRVGGVGRRMFNDGLRNTKSKLPDMRGRYVSLAAIEPEEKVKSRWIVTINIDGWPHSVVLLGEYEMDIFKQVQNIFKSQGAVVVEPRET